AGMQEKEIETFIDFCKTHAYKPIIIELDEGEIQQQPMISKVVKTTDVAVFNSELEKIKSTFLAHSYPISRVKIEVPLNYAYLAEEVFPKYKGRYGEWHARVRYDQ